MSSPSVTVDEHVRYLHPPFLLQQLSHSLEARAVSCAQNGTSRAPGRRASRLGREVPWPGTGRCRGWRCRREKHRLRQPGRCDKCAPSGTNMSLAVRAPSLTSTPESTLCPARGPSFASSVMGKASPTSLAAARPVGMPCRAKKCGAECERRGPRGRPHSPKDGRNEGCRNGATEVYPHSWLSSSGLTELGQCREGAARV